MIDTPILIIGTEFYDTVAIEGGITPPPCDDESA